MRFLWITPGFDHDPLERARVLPFLELHRPQSASNPRIEVSEQIFELLYPEIAHPALYIAVELLDHLGHR